ncbi:hypothetical protein EON67_04030 [archaeon]|nr:MAG: hypothetical protein EON67_04030 [archaeon]
MEAKPSSPSSSSSLTSGNTLLMFIRFARARRLLYAHAGANSWANGATYKACVPPRDNSVVSKR